MIAFAFADLQIQLDKTRQRNAVTVINPAHDVFHQLAPRPNNTRHEHPDLNANDISDELEKLHKRAEELRKQLEKLFELTSLGRGLKFAVPHFCIVSNIPKLSTNPSSGAC